MGIKITGVKVDHNERNWELYCGMDGVDEVAQKLNRTFEEAVAKGLDRYGVYDAVDKVMCENASFGAADSEPDRHLEDLLDRVFGTDERSW